MAIVTTFYCPYCGSVMYPNPTTGKHECPNPCCISNRVICPWCGLRNKCPVYTVPQTTDDSTKIKIEEE